MFPTVPRVFEPLLASPVSAESMGEQRHSGVGRHRTRD
jgi:hypothetical protein